LARANPEYGQVFKGRHQGDVCTSRVHMARCNVVVWSAWRTGGDARRRVDLETFIGVAG
jgi:hypothetical protein